MSEGRAIASPIFNQSFYRNSYTFSPSRVTNFLTATGLLCPMNQKRYALPNICCLVGSLFLPNLNQLLLFILYLVEFSLSPPIQTFSFSIEPFGFNYQTLRIGKDIYYSIPYIRTVQFCVKKIGNIPYLSSLFLRGWSFRTAPISLSVVFDNSHVLLLIRSIQAGFLGGSSRYHSLWLHSCSGRRPSTQPCVLRRHRPLSRTISNTTIPLLQLTVRPPLVSRQRTR